MQTGRWWRTESEDSFISPWSTKVKFDISENTVPCYTALGAGTSTHLGSHGNGGGKSQSGRKGDSLEVVVSLFHVFQGRNYIYSFFFFPVVQTITKNTT